MFAMPSLTLDPDLILSWQTVLVVLLGCLALVGYSFDRTNTIYSAFPRVADKGLLPLIWPSHIQDLVWEGYQKVRPWPCWRYPADFSRSPNQLVSPLPCGGGPGTS